MEIGVGVSVVAVLGVFVAAGVAAIFGSDDKEKKRTQ